VRTELIATYIRDSLKSFYTDNHGITVQSYRGGYLPNERRAIEKGLRDGSIQGVVCQSPRIHRCRRPASAV
jgi:DEAD/DEAH box helicase domain-containing protein